MRVRVPLDHRMGHISYTLKITNFGISPSLQMTTNNLNTWQVDPRVCSFVLLLFGGCIGRGVGLFGFFVGVVHGLLTGLEEPPYELVLLCKRGNYYLDSST